MPVLRCRRVIFFSDGDESAFFGFARSIKAVKRIVGEGDSILLHVAARPSGTSLRNLEGLFRRYRINRRPLTALKDRIEPANRALQRPTALPRSARAGVRR